MTHFKQILVTTAGAAIVATGLCAFTPSASAEASTAKPMATPMHMPTTAAEHAAEAAKYDQEAADLQSKADHHTTMAGLYRGLAGGGGKQEVSYRSITNHCEHLAGFYLKAATEARAMAAMHRELAKAG